MLVLWLPLSTALWCLSQHVRLTFGRGDVWDALRVLRFQLWWDTFLNSFHKNLFAPPKTNLKPFLFCLTENGTYLCNECDSKFAEEEALKRHTLQVHSDKPYKCDRCQAAFRYKGNLASHKTVHTGKNKQPLLQMSFWLQQSLFCLTSFHLCCRRETV